MSGPLENVRDLGIGLPRPGLNQEVDDSSHTFDIIIVGAGTAGCVLANRLSEDASLQILVIEAGRNCNDDPRVKTPGRSGECQGDSGLDWQFVTVPQEHLNNRTLSHPRGKLVGGSSAINSHAVVFPSRAWLDAWAAFGNKGWSAEEMVPYYHKFHSIAEPSTEVVESLKLSEYARAAETLDGPVRLSLPVVTEQLTQVWVDTFEKAGHRISESVLTGWRRAGGLIIPGAAAQGERSHAGTAYLKPALHRENLTLLEAATVLRVVLDQGDGADAIATGVECLENGLQRTYHARREVILCAGTFQSPKVLELSGVGDSKLLGPLGIPVIVDNPFVGENLQDHPNYGPSFEVNDGVLTSDAGRRDPALVQQTREQYQRDLTGNLAKAGVHTFWHSSLHMFDSTSEIIELLNVINSQTSSETGESVKRCLPSKKLQDAFVWSMIADPYEATATVCMVPMQLNLDQPPEKRKAVLQPGNYLSLLGMLSYPFSRGRVHIQSADPMAKPAVDFQYLSDDLDVQVFARHLMAVEKLVKLEPLASCLKPDGQRLPKTFSGKIETVDQARAVLRQCAGTNYHPACTCPMMSRDLGGVVDDRLVVHGTKNLRVCDASIFPVIPGGNILSSVYACAERGADLIKQDLGLT